MLKMINDKFYEKWLQASIIFKILSLVGIIIIIFGFLSLYFLLNSSDLFNKYNKKLDEYYIITIIQQGLSNNKGLLNKYLENFQVEYLNDFNDSVNEINRKISYISNDYNSYDKYFYIRAIKKSLKSYYTE